MRCPHCGGLMETDPNTGETSCNECGLADSENIVNDINFAENKMGTSSVVGTFISSQGPSAPALTARAMGARLTKNSYEVTLQKGRQKIQQLATALRLSQHQVDAAQRIFRMAVDRNFVQGRKTQNVVASCLYTVCRREKTPHMLIDFSDALSTNVFVLGATFLKLVQWLKLKLPIVDPSLYIHRFASKLEFGDKVHLVTTTALRLVASMKRDWMEIGRRPSGICGACLLIAARLHGFRRTQKEVIQVVKICDITLRRRLDEFEKTPSGQLTFEEFEQLDLENQGSKPCDPPSFSRNKQKAIADALIASSTGEGGVIGERMALLASVDTSRATVDMTARLRDEITTTAAGIDAVMAPHEISVQRTAPAPPPSEVTVTVAPLSATMTGAGDSTEGDGNVSDVEDDEVRMCVLSEAESKVKEQMWTELNREYLEQQAEKARLLEELGDLGGGSVATEPTKRKRKRTPGKKSETASEAVAEVLAKKSQYFDKEVLDSMFARPSSPRVLPTSGRPVPVEAAANQPVVLSALLSQMRRTITVGGTNADQSASGPSSPPKKPRTRSVTFKSERAGETAAGAGTSQAATYDEDDGDNAELWRVKQQLGIVDSRSQRHEQDGAVSDTEDAEVPADGD